MKATVVKRHTDGSGWLDVKVESEVGTLNLVTNAEGDYIDGAPMLDPSPELWLALAEAAATAERMSERTIYVCPQGCGWWEGDAHGVRPPPHHCRLIGEVVDMVPATVTQR